LLLGNGSVGVGVGIVRFGFPKFAWLKISKASARNWRLIRSVSFVFFTIEKSVFKKPGPAIAFLPRSPKWQVVGSTFPKLVNPVHGNTNAVGVLNHWDALPVPKTGPVTSGRNAPSPVVPVKLDMDVITLSGLPVCI